MGYHQEKFFGVLPDGETNPPVHLPIAPCCVSKEIILAGQAD
jgi:hypothetical protein